MTARSVVAALSVALFALAGCGGSGGSSSYDGKPGTEVLADQVAAATNWDLVSCEDSILDGITNEPGETLITCYGITQSGEDACAKFSVFDGEASLEGDLSYGKECQI